MLIQIHKAVQNQDREHLIRCLKNPHLWRNNSHRLETMKPINVSDAMLYIKIFKQFYENSDSDWILIDELVYLLKIAHSQIDYVESSNIYKF